MSGNSANAAFEGPIRPTVSGALIRDLLLSLRAICPETDLHRCLKRAGIVAEFINQPNARLTHDQLIGLYRECALVTGDEMLGLWSRPIRTGTLKYLVRAVLEAPAIRVALYRFVQFWNLLLDDYRLDLRRDAAVMTITLIPRSQNCEINRFGHALMLKLTHGILSWLADREVVVHRVAFSFPRPDFAPDYAILFPAPVGFEARYSAISVPAQLGAIRSERSAYEARAFLERAPRDWIFTRHREHAIRLKVRELLYADLGQTLEDVSQRLNLSSRTLIRKLQAERLSFQCIKNELRRDLATLHLDLDDVSLSEIAYALGFSSPAVFHRAFRQWTGMTPGAYRNARKQVRTGGRQRTTGRNVSVSPRCINSK